MKQSTQTVTIKISYPKHLKCYKCFPENELLNCMCKLCYELD